MVEKPETRPWGIATAATLRLDKWTLKLGVHSPNLMGSGQIRSWLKEGGKETGKQRIRVPRDSTTKMLASGEDFKNSPGKVSRVWLPTVINQTPQKENKKLRHRVIKMGFTSGEISFRRSPEKAACFYFQFSCARCEHRVWKSKSIAKIRFQKWCTYNPLKDFEARKWNAQRGESDILCTSKNVLFGGNWLLLKCTFLLCHRETS